MKFKNYIAALLASYMFVLMLLPCNDACNSHDHAVPTTIEAAQDHHQEESDVCSPFCFCSCCSTVMTTFYVPAFSFVTPVSVRDFCLHEQEFLSKESSSIWQPPKIS